jgi:hypothetical protein
MPCRGLPSPREAVGRVGAEGAGVGGPFSCASFAPHPQPLPTARKNSRGEGSRQCLMWCLMLVQRRYVAP